MFDERSYQQYLKDEESLALVLEAADLPTSRARNESPTLTYHGVRIHSAMDPVAEAIQLVASMHDEISRISGPECKDGVTCYIIGPGLGYLILALEKYLNDHCHILPRINVICVEAEPEVARKAIQLRVWEPCSLNVRWIVGDPCLTAVADLEKLKSKVIIKNTIGYRQNRALYDQFLHSLNGELHAERPMRILVPTPLYGGSLPAALHCASAFEKLGHQVERLDLTPYYRAYTEVEEITRQPGHRKSLQGMLAGYLAEVIAARALDFKADLVWAVAQTPLTPTALEELRAHGVHTAFWFVEDYRLFNYWKEIAGYYDAVFTIQRNGFHEELISHGARLVSYLPCAANEEVHRPCRLTDEEKTRFGSDVSFVGAGYYNRQVTFTKLALNNFKIWGNDWPEQSAARRWVQENARRVSTEDSVKIFSASTINLNLHSSTNHSGVNPYGDFVNPRTFEIAACEGFQLVDARSELTELFEEGKELAVFRNTDELADLIEYYLSHKSECKEMARKSKQRVLKEHTYVHRMKHALEFLEQKLPRLKDRKKGPNYVSSLKQAAGDDQELVDFLSAFNEEEELDLDKIVARIQLGKGKLTRPEGIFLLMKEFRDWGREKGVIS